MRFRTPRTALVTAAVATFVLAWASTGHTDDGKPGEVSIMPRWKVGERQRYERVKTRRKTQGKMSAKASGRGPIDVSVVEAGEKGYLVRWRIGETTDDNPRAAADPLTQAMNRLTVGLEVDLEIDNEATITGVRNWAEMKSSGQKIAETLIQAQQAAGTDAKTLGAVRSTVEGLFATKERVEQLFAKEPQLFFVPIGRTYPGVGKAVEYDDQLPNPLGGPPFPCTGKFTLTSYDADKGRAEVSWTQTVDPKEAARIMLETLKAIAQRSGRIPPGADELKALTVEDRAEFVIDTRTGWVETLTHTRTTKTRGGSQEDILSMSRQSLPR